MARATPAVSTSAPVSGAREVLTGPRWAETAARIGLVGSSETYLRTMETIGRLAGVDVPVLLTGETGTGKELAARAIHYLGRRRDRPFVPVDCGALPETLFESELFGHVRGSFTDARRDSVGLVTQAEGGTLFFDEIMRSASAARRRRCASCRISRIVRSARRTVARPTSG